MLTGSARVYGWFVPRVVLPWLDRVTGRRVAARLAHLRARQWWPAARLEEDATVRLRQLLGHAARHVPYYRRRLADADVRPEDIRSLADVVRVPVTTKLDLLDAGIERTTATNLPTSRRWPITTSGSTGIPFRFYADLGAEDTRLATHLLALEWAGVGIWDADVRLGSPFRDAAWLYPPPGPLARLGRRVLLGQRTFRLSAPRATVEDLRRLVRRAAGRRCMFFWGFPSIMALLADQLVETGMGLPAYPTVVVSRGESLTTARREAIARAFRAPVVNHYGCNEVADVAQSCPNQPDVLHAFGDRVIVQVLREDGRLAGPGERGRVLVTDLENHVMPFINYALGDVAVAGPPCASGRQLPVLTAVEGRDSETVRLPGGQRLSGFVVEAQLRLTSDPAVLRAYQVVQTAIDRVEVKVVATPRFTGADAERLQQGLESLLGPGLAVQVSPVDEIPAEPSGKRLAVKSTLTS